MEEEKKSKVDVVTIVFGVIGAIVLLYLLSIVFVKKRNITNQQLVDKLV